MSDRFDEQYWEDHWRHVPERERGHVVAVSPYLVQAVEGVSPGTALDAGSGEGTEAFWLAQAGWKVTAVDISAEAQRRAAALEAQRREASGRAGEPVQWLAADLDAWEPGGCFDLVATHYAHPATPQLAFYQRIAHWVAPGGTLLIVGHLHSSGAHGHSHGAHGHGAHGHGHEGPPDEVSVRAADVAALFDPSGWEVQVAEECSRSVSRGAGRTAELHDVVVRAVRRAGGQP